MNYVDHVQSNTAANENVTDLGIASRPQPFRAVRIGGATLYLGDAADVLPSLSNIDACVADGPYGLSFMGKAWDYDVPQASFWSLVWDALKPGAHVVNFASARTYHRMAVQVEDASFEVRDQLLWVYGSGFPKSRNVSKDIDKRQGAKRPVAGTHRRLGYNRLQEAHAVQTVNVKEFAKLDNVPLTHDAQTWDGWGTGVKPSHEPIVLARKPFKGAVYKNVLRHGTGALNINACRVATSGKDASKHKAAWDSPMTSDLRGAAYNSRKGKTARTTIAPEGGRWPANLIHDGSDAVVAQLSDVKRSKGGKRKKDSGSVNAYSGSGIGDKAGAVSIAYDERGSAARFFYCAKASKADREEGNDHPTVKPTALMKWLCNLVTPKGGVILDPFMGSGSTGKAALQEGFEFIGIERELHSFEIACARIAAVQGLTLADVVELAA